MKKIMIILAMAMLVGCGPSPQEAFKQTQETLKNPKYVGITPDGQKIYRYEVITPYGNHNHYIYRFGDLPTVSINRTVPSGKSSYNQVIVIVGGKTNSFNMGEAESN